MFAEVLTMQRTRWFTVVAVALTVGAATAGLSAVRGRPVLVATGNEVVTMGKYGLGEVRCIGGQPTGDLMLPCSPGTRKTLIRGMRSASVVANVVGPAASFLDGEDVMNNSCNLDENMQGQCWGTLEWTIPGKGGRWEGAWMGQFDIRAFTASYAAVAVGRGGDLEGLRLQYHAVSPGWSGQPGMSPPYPIVFTAEVIDR
jgi:hypothetical protein